MLTLEEIKNKCNECRQCSLCKTRTNIVFGKGNEHANLLFVGEAPGEQEDLSGIPFVGRAGKLLDDFLFAVGIPKNEVYIANILKCRPPKNRDPLPDEEDACIVFLRDQVRAINPKLIVCLGRISAMRLIKPDYKITLEHGTWVQKGNFLMTAVYHPAALLRDPNKNGDMLKDLMDIKDKLEKIKRGQT